MLYEVITGYARLIYSTAHAIEQEVLMADLVIGSVLIPGAAAPKLVSADLVRRMKPGAAIVDVAIDQGGCVATSHPTTHSQPTYIVDQVGGRRRRRSRQSEFNRLGQNARRNAPSGRCAVGRRRITSYNVCYTKLLREITF